MTKNSKIRWISLIALGLALTACLKDSPGGTVESFHYRVEAGKLDGAIELLSKATRAQLPEEKLKQGLHEVTREIVDKGGIEKIEITKEEIIGETAEVEVRITFGDGTEEMDQNTLIKEGGRWRLQPSSKGK